MFHTKSFRFRCSKQKTKLIFTTKINHTKIKILSMQLEKKQFVDTTMGLVDHATQEAIVAEFSNIVLKSSDVAIFTADSDVNKDGKIDVVGVSEGTATLHVSADATYVDKNTGLSVTISKAAEISVTITAPPITAENTDLIVSFSAPVPVPVI